MLVDTWSEVLLRSFQDLWAGLVEYVPNLVVALIIIVLGWIIGALIGRVVSQLFKSLKIDKALESAGVGKALDRGGVSLDSGAFVGALVKWFVIIVFLVAAFDVLGLAQVNLFLQEVVLLYLPRVIVAAVVLVAAGVLGDIVKKLVVGSVNAAGFGHANLAGNVSKWAIWIFGLLVALDQLGIAATFVQTLFTGVVVAVALALGLSFGLGGQSAAASFIEKTRNEIANK
ncbi:MAG: hypothetical protein MRY49_02090 [Candidatus Pacebacteria bacterium]|nr:hypothetical protein [Candidatus Paceibacterota bacterium]